jgi:hypothetical protein
MIGIGPTVSENEINVPIVETGCPLPTLQNTHHGIEDHQAAFAEATLATPVGEAFRTAFLRSKLRTASTHPVLDIAAQDRAVQSLVERLGPQARGMLAQPAPGGIGYGVFYTPTFKTGWGNATAVICDFVCPTLPGGNINTFLYLTATNRAALGVEALVAYDGQRRPHFEVFDWARPDHWQTNIPSSALEKYLSGLSSHGHPYLVLPVWNSATLVDADRYRNQVLLYDQVRGGWDLIYQYDYGATDSQQKSGWVGSWGPLVEAFQPRYMRTNQLGAVDVQLVSADDTGQWGSWMRLAPLNSYIRADNLGFHLAFLDPNYAFTVDS